MKYNDIENAVITFYGEYLNIERILKDNFKILLDLNVKIINLYINYHEINEYKNLLEELFKCYESDELIINIHFHNVNAEYINIDYPNYFMVNHRFDGSKINDNFYYYFVVNEKNVKQIAKNVIKCENPIVYFDVDVSHLKTFNNTISTFFTVLNKEVCIDNYFIPTDILKEHPCNGYLCNGIFCKKIISKFPRKLIVNEQGKVYAHSKDYELLNLGNLNNSKIDKILLDYVSNYETSKIASMIKKVYINYVHDYPFYFFPWESFFLKEVADHYEKS